ncbi:hypothetical protein BU26DRAFT_521103 [Trematosphaeria pertusa]|uniref:Cryptic loci regulator 2 N-terminal domain-containing protein n=1 Tax=Trematosphaeria pertusa TaxID=390896 RepID=A0A6A6I8H5_9PLEO|nr:uncharacterized protein BU26DRAFT_521103 [Trematosphaeria pertusa]KAF2246656.1 hypothetical protein BU26DRAFT_521103 [Trematosphaeria pertusa]
MSTRRIVVPLRPGSDGDATHKPTSPSYSEVNPPTIYLERLAAQWMQARGEAVPGMIYILERLPAGYALFQRPRPKDQKIYDKYLYGHPQHKPFDSPNRFFPHFQYIMENGGSSLGCPCTVCNTKGGVLPKTGLTSGFFSKGGSSKGGSSKGGSSKGGSSGASSRTSTQKAAPVATAPVAPQFKGRPKMIGTGMDTSRVDEEGTPDVYRNLIDKLKRHGTLDEAIMEPMSLDWRAEQEILPGVLSKIKKEPQWVPRAGDIVLYVREMPYNATLVRHPTTGVYVFYDRHQKTILDVPRWEAGLVGQTPAEALQEGEKDFSVSYSGVRVEPLPSPNNPDKSLSKRYKYVPVHYTRPFNLWKEYLEQVPQDNWHPTIKNALTVMSTMSLVGKHRFHGTWPEAQIRCHGIYIGSEMLAIGDTVRLLPKAHGESVCTDVLVIKSIRLKILNLDKASTNDYDEGRPYNSEAWIYGAAYTTEPSRSSKEWLTDTKPPKSAQNYPDMYPLHPPNKEIAVPFSRVLGRLFEHDAMLLWLNSAPSLDEGREGLLEARAFGRAHDNRITQSFGATWYWGDTRSEALDLHTINGLEVGKSDTERDPGAWRKKIKVMDGQPNAQVKLDAGHKSLRNFMAPATSKLPVRRQNLLPSSSDSSSGGSSRSGRKREANDESRNEEEIREQMRIIEDDGQPSMSQKKKAKVMVVID